LPNGSLFLSVGCLVEAVLFAAEVVRSSADLACIGSPNTSNRDRIGRNFWSRLVFESAGQPDLAVDRRVDGTPVTDGHPAGPA
jgi:hypothetical protein